MNDNIASFSPFQSPIKFIDRGEFSALLLIEMTLAKNWCAK